MRYRTHTEFSLMEIRGIHGQTSSTMLLVHVFEVFGHHLYIISIYLYYLFYGHDWVVYIITPDSLGGCRSGI